MQIENKFMEKTNYNRGSVSDISSDDDTQSYYKCNYADPTYVSLIDKINKRIESKDCWFSCEFFPPRTPNGAVNLVSKFDKFAKGKPLFCDVTWHAAGDPISDNPTSSTVIANTMLNYCGIETMLHMTCVKLTENEINMALTKAKRYGIKNIMALRGDLPDGMEAWQATTEGFNYGSDLVRHIRRKFGNNFVISVAGYPNAHPESTNYAQDLQHLKEKVDCGADFIVTQLFFDVKTFLKFERNCREIGIKCPIIPGIMPIQAYQSLRHIVKLSKLEVPTEILKIVESLRDNEDAIRNYGIDLGVKMCKELLNSGVVFGIHFYTLNRDIATISILKQIGLWADNVPRELPWKRAANHERVMEGIRPIFWSNRPNSYVYRTKHWDDFPTCRWGDTSGVSTFKELEDPYLFYLRVRASKEDLLQMWGHELRTEQDVYDVFYYHISGKLNQNGVHVKSLPWNPNSELSSETRLIQSELATLNQKGILTINSQPRANGISSTDEVLGWGPAGGFVYQKAYLEFFIHYRYIDSLLKVLNSKEYSTRVNYHIVQAINVGDTTNCDEVQPIAVTWGIFPGSEIVQPTVVDPLAFKYWKQEAFDLWLRHWAILYEKDSPSHQLLYYIHDNYLLVNLVDNNFTEENCLFNLVHEAYELTQSTTTNGH